MLSEIRNHALSQWVILGLSVVAFIVLMKTAASYLPDGGVTGSVKRVALAV